MFTAKQANFTHLYRQAFELYTFNKARKNRQISCIHRSIINFAFSQQRIHHQACNKDSYIRCRSLICMLRPHQDRPCSSNIHNPHQNVIHTAFATADYFLRLCHNSLLFKHLFKYTIYKYKCVLHFFISLSETLENLPSISSSISFFIFSIKRIASSVSLMLITLRLSGFAF